MDSDHADGGAIIIGFGYALACFAVSTVWQVSLVGMVIGASVGLSYVAIPSLITGSVPVTESAAANGLNSVMRSIGTSSSAAVTGVVLAGMSLTLGTSAIPSLEAFRATFAISIVASVAELVLSGLIPIRIPATEPEVGHLVLTERPTS